MRGSVIGMAVLAGSVVLAGTARAQNQSNAPDAPHSRFGNPTSIARIYQTYIFGVVKKVEKSDLILDKTKFGNEQYFKLNKDTKFIRNGKPSHAVLLKPGEMVWIDMKRDKKSGDMIAKKVVVGVAPTGGPSKK
jgi:hypothetical protein